MRHNVRAALVRVRELFRRRGREAAERDDEFRFHIEMETAENIRRGMSEPEARRAALVRFGGRQRFQEETSEARGIIAIERWGQHLRHGMRAMRRQPAFSLAAVLTLALGIGFNTAIFTVFYALGFRDFAVRDADRLVNVYHEFVGNVRRPVHGFQEMVSWHDFDAYMQALRAAPPGESRIQSAAVYAPATFTLTAERATSVLGQYVSCGYFATLAVRMVRGRGFVDEECARQGESPVAVMSHAAWQRELGGDSAAIGRRVRINQTQFTLVGVAERGFGGVTIQPADLWIPAPMQPVVDHGQGVDSMFVGDWSWMMMVARLAPGAEADDARAQLAVVASQRDRLFPGRETRVVVTRGALLNFPEARNRGAIVMALLGALGALVVVMICANLMNLLLARGITRRREIGIRLAVGASRRRLVEQLVVESGLLALFGGALGLALAFLLPWLFTRLVSVPLQVNLAPDARVLAFTALVSLATAFFFGLIPAWRATSVDLVTAFKGGAGDGRQERAPSRLRSMIVGVQVAGSALLLIVAALLVRSARNGASLDLGYTVDNVATFELNLPMLGYTPERASATYAVLTERIAAIPGVRTVSLASPLPLLGRRSGMLRDASGPPDAEALNPSMVTATHSHFAALDIPIVAGRAYNDAEVTAAGPNGEQPVVVSRALARTLESTGEVIGRRLRMEQTPVRVVGVAADARVTSISDAAIPFIYLPAHPGRDQELFLVVRTDGAPTSVERLVPRIAAGLDPSIVVKSQRLRDRLALELLPARISSATAGTMGALTLLLALVGIYGVVSFAVTQRTRDIAVRRALGATDHSVVGLVMRQGSRPVFVGLVLGAAIALAVSRALRGVLISVGTIDPVSFGSAIAVLVLAAGIATWVPARRASRVDPARVLRED